MNDTDGVWYFYFKVIIFGLIFLAMSTFTIFVAIGQFAFNSNISNYLFLLLGFLMLTVTVCLFLGLPKNKSLNAIIIAAFAIFSLSLFINKEDIKSWFVDENYSSVSKAMINGNDMVIETAMYNQFLIDKKNKNVERLKEYLDNPSQYSSINLEQVMNLKLFHSSTKNNDIKMKLDDMFKDKIVTKLEYSNFQKFIANHSIDSKELALLSMINK